MTVVRYGLPMASRTASGDAPDPAGVLAANVGLVQRIYDAGYNLGDGAVFDECYATDFVHHSKVIHDVAAGARGERESMERFREAIPDVHFTVLDTTAEDDRVAARLLIAGHPTSAFGPVPAGGHWSVRALALFRISEGRVAEEWLFVDGGVP